MDNSLAQEYDINPYPTVGPDDWRYAFAAARARTLESMMLHKSILHEMANAVDFNAAVNCLSGTEYAIQTSNPTIDDIEQMLLDQRTEARNIFNELMLDKPLCNLVKARADFTNMRLAVRRVVTDRPIGVDYSDDGSVSAEVFEEVFEQENYSEFPEYLQEAVEAAVLGYYENKDIRQIDFAISKVTTEISIAKAREYDCPFLLSLTRIKIDLDNIRSMLRLKFLESAQRGPFLPNGFIKIDTFLHGLDLGYDGLGQLFYHTPYSHIVDAGVAYLLKNGSFLSLESHCESYLWNCYKSAMEQVTAGPQPVIAYLLMKELEIRNVRMILTAKKNQLSPELIIDRLGEGQEG